MADGPAPLFAIDKPTPGTVDEDERVARERDRRDALALSAAFDHFTRDQRNVAVGGS